MSHLKNRICIQNLFLVSTIVLICFPKLIFGQTSEVIVPSNISTGTLEKNLLFNASQRFTVTQTGTAELNLNRIFDGSFMPSTTTVPLDSLNPTIILVEDLPPLHRQKGAWVGWSSRNYFPIKFKIEAFDYTNGIWLTVADVENHSERHFMKLLPSKIFSKLKYTFFEANGSNGKLQISEIFYIHPEGASAYDGLLVKYSNNLNVGIGIENPSDRLEVNGKIRAHEIKLETTNWPDYVFKEEYNLLSMEELKSFIKKEGHLPGFESADKYQDEGVNQMELNQRLIEKIEELTLYLIQKDEEIKNLEKKIKRLDVNRL